MAVEHALEQLHRAKWTQAAREAYHKESPENFAGPDMSFPIRDGSDVADAWGLAGHAADPDAVRNKIKAIAKRLGLESSLPDTAKEDSKERAMGTELSRAAANHEPMSGTHAHIHPAFGAQGDDSTHEHEHEHNDDNNHDHEHSEERAQVAAIQVSDRPMMYAPIMRIDAAKREVWGQATAEVPDSYGTIFGYYPEAWKTWRGNVREQHDGKKAVGRRIELECNDQERAIYVGSRVSRGAQDTWLKVEDNVLTGYSASIIPDPEFGPDPRKWPKKEYNGKQYPYLPRYTVAELSLVDNPACPGCNIQIVRADGFATDVLDTTEEEIPHPEPETQPLERAGARVSSDTMSKMHDSIKHTLHAAVSQMQNCGCDTCMAAQKALDPDMDGDIDLGGYDDPDKDADALYSKTDMERKITGMIERALTPVYSRLQSIAGTLARSSNPQFFTNSSSLESIVSGALTRALADLPTKSSFDEVRSALAEVKGQVDKIAETPVPGMPVMNAGSLPRPVEKRLATDPYQAPQKSGSSVYDAIQRMSEAGMLDTPDRQADAVAAGLLAQRYGR